MKTPRHRSMLNLGCLLAAVSLAILPATLRAQRYIWTGGTGNWGDASKWAKPDMDYPYPVPETEGPTVLIDGGKTGIKSTVTLDNSDAPVHYEAGPMTIDAGDTLIMQGFGNFEAITNNGAINFSAISGGGYELQFALDGGTIDGTGTITMTEDDQYIHTPNNPNRITIDEGQTIQGRGNLGDGNTNFTNGGLIDANVSGETLRIYPGYNSVDFTNTSTGVAEASKGGTLLLDGAYGNAVFEDGTFTALDGSEITTSSSPTVSNCTITTTGTGMFSVPDSTAMTGISLQGNLVVTGTATFDGTIESNGVITDNGNLTFPNGLDNDGGTLIISDDGVFRVTGDLANNGTIELGTSVGGELAYTGSPTLSGTGILRLNGPSALVQGPNMAGAERLTLDAGQTVEGQGNFLGNDGTCTNKGLVNANVSGTTLTIQPDFSYDFTNSGNGYAEATNGGTLNLTGATFQGGSFRALDGSEITINDSAVVTKTTLSTSGSGVIDLHSQATVTDVTLNGTFNIEDTTGHFNGTITNNGVINVGTTTGGTILYSDKTSLVGTGIVNLVGSAAGVTGPDDIGNERMTIGAGQVIQGQGNFGEGNSAFTNNGVVKANVPGATLTLSPNTGSPGDDFTNVGKGFAEAINGATLQLTGGIFAGGSFQALAGSVLSLSAGTFNNTTLSSTGTGVVTIGSFITVNNVIFSGTVNNPDGQLHLSGPLTNNATLTLGAAASGGNSPEQGQINAENNAVLTNNADHLIQGQGIIRCAVVNDGGITTQFGDAGALSFTSASLTNNGTLTVSDNTTLTQDTSTTLTNYDASSQTLKGGTYRVNAGTHTTTLSPNIGTVAVNDATVILSGANSVFTPINGLTDNEGTFSLLKLRQFTTAGALSNEGTINLDAGSTLHVAGALTTTAASTLSFVIGGTATSGAKSPGVLQVNGKVTLAGNLIVTLASGATLPKYTDTFTIFSASSTPGGSFANVANGARIDTADGKGSFGVSYGAASADAPTQIVLNHFSTQLASVITSPKTAAGTQGKTFSYQITASNSPTKFGVNSLPGGLSLAAATGLISGTPTAAGKFTITLFAYNSAGHSSAILTLTIAAAKPVITSAAAAAATAGQAFSYQITASNHPTSYGVGGLFGGITVNKETGVISGTPTAAEAGTHTLTLQAANAAGTGTQTLTLTIKVVQPVVTSPDTATATVGKAFSYQITATNDPTSYGVGGLFKGITVDQQTGLISGTLTAAGTHSLTLRAANGAGTGSETLALTVTN